MGRLEELIAELCQNGVEFKQLKEVCSFQRGQTITQKNISVPGDVPVIAGGQNPAYYHNISNRIGKTITVSASGVYAGYVGYWEIPIFMSDAFSIVPIDKYQLSIRYLYHFLKKEQNKIYSTKKGGGVPHVSPKSINYFVIPLPPLQIQEEIVRILDKFLELEAELEDELEARKIQYQYYLEYLLNADTTSLKDRDTSTSGIRWMKLGDIGKVSMCKRIMKHETSPEGDIPFYKIGTFGKKPDAYISRQKYEQYKKKYNYPKKGNILISASGTIGRTVIYSGEEAYYQDSNIVWIANDEKQVLDKYLYYFYQLQPWSVSIGGTISRLYNDNIEKTLIPVPSLDEQVRIVSILDRFDTICNDLTSGLPAEIAARRKQYEYYRDKLLTFKEKSA